jgi:hypothetical protein
VNETEQEEGEQTLDGPQHNWEKRAKDSQRSFSKERNARLKAEEAINEAVSEMARQRSEFEKLMSRFNTGSTATLEPDKSEVANEVLDNFREIYPDIAEGVDQVMKPVRTEVEQLRKERLERDVRDHTDKFLSEAGRDPRLKDYDLKTIVGSDDLASWLESTGGYSARVMNNTFDPNYGFTPKDVADVIARYTQEIGAKPGVRVQSGSEPPAPRPNIPTGSTGLGNDNTPGDIFSLNELQNLQSLADKVGRLANKVGKPEMFEQFDEKLDRSLRFYDAQAKKQRSPNR